MAAPTASGGFMPIEVPFRDETEGFAPIEIDRPPAPEPDAQKPAKPAPNKAAESAEKEA